MLLTAEPLPRVWPTCALSEEERAERLKNLTEIPFVEQGRIKRLLAEYSAATRQQPHEPTALGSLSFEHTFVEQVEARNADISSSRSPLRFDGEIPD
jgi:hypothetical protein